MAQFALMLRDNGSFPADLSPEEIQQVIQRYTSWKQKVNGKGQKLYDNEGRVVVRKDGGIAVTDGPYVESKEILGGYFLIEANDYDAVSALIEDCPHLDFGSIEIRRIERG